MGVVREKGSGWIYFAADVPGNWTKRHGKRESKDIYSQNRNNTSDSKFGISQLVLWWKSTDEICWNALLMICLRR